MEGWSNKKTSQKNIQWAGNCGGAKCFWDEGYVILFKEVLNLKSTEFSLYFTLQIKMNNYSWNMINKIKTVIIMK